MKTLSQLEQLLGIPMPIIALESDNPAKIVNSFRQLEIETGQAIYTWRPENGLARLAQRRVAIPNTRSIEAMLHFIASSPHFGIYVLQKFSSYLDDPRIVSQLKTIATTRLISNRRIILLDTNIQLPEPLRRFAIQVQHKPQQRRLLRQAE